MLADDIVGADVPRNERSRVIPAVGRRMRRPYTSTIDHATAVAAKSPKAKATLSGGLLLLVEAAGIEPASEDPTSQVLHAYRSFGLDRGMPERALTLGPACWFSSLTPRHRQRLSG